MARSGTVMVSDLDVLRRVEPADECGAEWHVGGGDLHHLDGGRRRRRDLVILTGGDAGTCQNGGQNREAEGPWPRVEQGEIVFKLEIRAVRIVGKRAGVNSRTSKAKSPPYLPET
jgi:hypothetical protein